MSQQMGDLHRNTGLQRLTRASTDTSQTRKAGSDPFRASLDMSPGIDVTQWFHVLQLHLLAFGATDANGASDANSALFPLLLTNGASDAKI